MRSGCRHGGCRKGVFLSTYSAHNVAALGHQMLHERIKTLLILGEDGAFGLGILAQILAQIESDAKITSIALNAQDAYIGEPVPHTLCLDREVGRKVSLLTSQY